MPRPPAPPAQDFVEIQNLYGYYNLASDAGDAEAYAGCFTDDGVLKINHLNFTVKGRADLIAFKEKDKAGRAGRYRRHWNGSILLEKLDERTVRGRCYLHGFNGMPGSLPELADVGVYEDLIVKVGGEWRFASRTILMDGSRWQPAGDGIRAMSGDVFWMNARRLTRECAGIGASVDLVVVS